MGFTPIEIKDEVLSGPPRAKITLDNGSVLAWEAKIELSTPVETEGDMFSGLFAGNVQDWIAEADVKLSKSNAQYQTVTLTNTQVYPFNNSVKTISLSPARSNNAYAVLTEVVGETGGGAGDIRITDKTTSGFKIAYTGAASSINVRCVIIGG